MLDLVIVGAGPIGISCGLEARRAGLDALIVEKGALVNSFVGYPPNMEMFSTPDLLEIGGYPMSCRGYKPLREECIDYYRRVAQAEQLDIRLYETLSGIDGHLGKFDVITSRASYPTRFVVLATGFFDIPNRLGVPGEDLPKVSHYYREPYAYSRQRLAVVGAKNSAAKAALECERHGAEVTLIHRGAELSPSVKYWIRPNLINRISDGAITAHFGTVVEEIRPESLLLRTPSGRREIANDYVLALTGYQPDYAMLERLGIACAGDARVPVYDDQTFETSRAGVYMAGTVLGGLETSRWFIENGRFHAAQIIRHVASRRLGE